MKIFQNFKSEWQIKDNLQDAKVKINLFISEINIYLNSWSKFLLNNRQPFRALKFNRQPSKLPPHWYPQKGAKMPIFTPHPCALPCLFRLT